MKGLLFQSIAFYVRRIVATRMDGKQLHKGPIFRWISRTLATGTTSKWPLDNYNS